jgi:hypothetical protein
MNLPAAIRGRRANEAGLWAFSALLLLLVVSTTSVHRAEAATNVVYNTNDTGAGSLRQVIQDSAPTDTIFFSNVVTGTITLATGELLVNKSLSILGPGAKLLALSGNTSNRVFEVATGLVNISGLTIRDGKKLGAIIANQGQDGAGGGIYCAQPATLTVTECIISNCFAVGGSGGNSPGPGQYGGWGGYAFGGGIFNEGALTLERCWVVGNQAIGGKGGDGGLDGYGGMGGYAYGGGIYHRSNNLTMRGCTLSANQANYGHEGGGTSAGLPGNAAAGGMENLGGAATLVNCTVSGNIVHGVVLGSGSGFGWGGGIVSGPVGNGSASLVLVSCTVAGNFSDGSNGGIASDANGTPCCVTNSLIAGNTAGSAPDVGGGFTSGGYNFIGNPSGSGSAFVNGVNNDQVGTGESPLNPLLSPLGDFGGGTPTHALSSGSPAIDQGKSFGLATDQRGAPRPFDFASITEASDGDGSDIGAFELGRPTLNIQKFNTNAILSWQSYYGDFTLQSVTNVIASNSWATVADMPTVVANQYVLTNGPISGNEFFRLKGN